MDTFIEQDQDMETIAFVPNKVSHRRNMNNKKLNSNEICLINTINLILEVIMANSVKFNKLTSLEEIQERLSGFATEEHPCSDKYKDLDIDSIKYICDAFCVEKGVLLRLNKNNESFYKLNWLEDA